MDISSTLAALSAETLSVDDAKNRYVALVDQLMDAQLCDQAQTLLDHLLNGNVPKTVSIPSLNYLTQSINKINDDDKLHTFCRYGVEKFKQIPNAFDQADANLKECLSEIYICEDDPETPAEERAILYTKAAAVLTEIDLSRGCFDEKYKVNINVRIAALFADDAVGDVHKADRYIKEARNYLRAITDVTILLRYRAIQAKVHDLNKNFLQAASEYYRMTTDKTANVIEDEEIKNLLTKALTCAVLGGVDNGDNTNAAQINARKSRMLGTLHKDKRTHDLEFFNIMSNMYKSKLLSQEDVESFSKTLLEHQKAIVSGTNNMTILQMAVLEHNMLACSLLYNNITFEQLGSLLNVSPEEAEQVSSKMIQRARLSGVIDQIEGILYFGNESSTTSTLIDWDHEIGYICSEMNAINDKISATKN